MTNSEVPKYERRRRVGPLTFRAKWAQALGAVPETIKSWAFSTFILLYYNRILGLDAFVVSSALAVAVVVDAFLDPLVGSFSDNLHTRWGRRHPLMLLGAAPLGLAFYGVFSPPATLSHTGLFIWLTSFVLLTHALMSLFDVPWSAMAAELSDDYTERTSIMSYRFLLGGGFRVLFPAFIYTFIMPGTRGNPVGQLNPAHYPAMAMCAGVLMSGFGVLATLRTLDEIPYLRRHALAPRSFRLTQVATDLVRALRNDQFALIFLVGLLNAAIAGATANIHIYMMTYYWGLTSEDLKWLALSSFAGVFAFPLLAFAQRQWDKKHILLACWILSLVNGLALVSLRLLALLPKNGDPALLIILIGANIVSGLLGVVQGVISVSLVADILDQHELKTGYRQEAMFNAALSFSSKAVSSLGIVLAGVILSVIDLPREAAPGAVPSATLRLMGLVVGIFLPMFYLIPIYLIGRYRITRKVHADIQRQLIALRE